MVEGSNKTQQDGDSNPQKQQEPINSKNLITSAQITISGRTNPNSQVVAYTDTNEEIFESDESGNFSGVLLLEEGPSEITFTAFGNNEEEVTETKSVVYVTES